MKAKRTKTSVWLGNDERRQIAAIRKAFKLKTDGAAIRKALDLATRGDGDSVFLDVCVELLQFADKLAFKSPAEERKLRAITRKIYEIESRRVARREFSSSGTKGEE